MIKALADILKSKDNIFCSHILMLRTLMFEYLIFHVYTHIIFVVSIYSKLITYKAN